MDDDSDIEVLQLVTTRRPFFEQQVQVLESRGISCTVLPVPQSSGDTRSVLDYARFHGQALHRTVAGDFDVVHANYGLTAPIALTQPLRPVVLTLWGSDVLGRYGRVSEVCSSLCDAVIVMTDEMADQIDCDAHVIPHGIDTERFTDEPASWARSKVGWKRNAKHVLFPYDPSRSVKDYPRAESVVDVVDDRFDVPVELHAVYGVSHERVPIYMNAADALLLTSKREGSPNTVKEALACNLPVISTDVGDVSDLLADIDNCAVCQTDGELVRMLQQILESDEMVGGRDRVQEFSLRHMGRELRGVYDDVLSDS